MRAVIVFEQTVLKFANQVERFRIAITYKNEDGSTEAYFVDSCGFVELTDFFVAAQKKPAEM